MLSRAFDHICMEKARYKFLIIIIIIIIIIIMFVSDWCITNLAGGFRSKALLAHY